MTFGERLRNARIAQKLSQIELAEKVGVTERSIYSYEQAGFSPKMSVLMKLADTLKVTVAYLTDEDETDKLKSIDDELFVANAKEKYGYKGAREATKLISEVSALFAGGELSDEAKEVFFRSITEVYFESKEEARKKFTPKKYRDKKE